MSLKKGRQKQYYEVEAIRDRRVNKQTGSREYLVKWKDWPEETNTWEPPCNLSFVIDMIQAFQKGLKHRQTTRQRQNITKPKAEVTEVDDRAPHRTRRIKKARKRSNRFKRSDSKDGVGAEPITIHDHEKPRLQNGRTQKDLKGSGAVSQPSSTDYYQPCLAEMRNNQDGLVGIDEQEKSEQSVKIVNVRYVTRSQVPKINTAAVQTGQNLKIQQPLEELREFDLQSIANGKVQILEAAFVNQQLYYKVRELRGNSRPIFVTSEVFRELNPLLIIQYYAKNI